MHSVHHVEVASSKFQDDDYHSTFATLVLIKLILERPNCLESVFFRSRNFIWEIVSNPELLNLEILFTNHLSIHNMHVKGTTVCDPSKT